MSTEAFVRDVKINFASEGTVRAIGKVYTNDPNVSSFSIRVINIGGHLKVAMPGNRVETGEGTPRFYPDITLEPEAKEEVDTKTLRAYRLFTQAKH